MDDVLPGLWSLSPIGALIGMIVLFFIALLRGWLIPKSSHERELAQANKRGDEWKETALTTRAALVETQGQNRILLESNRITEAFFRTATPHDIAELTGEGHVGT